MILRVQLSQQFNMKQAAGKTPVHSDREDGGKMFFGNVG
jgi:hypothetical protein